MRTSRPIQRLAPETCYVYLDAPPYGWVSCEIVGHDMALEYADRAVEAGARYATIFPVTGHAAIMRRVAGKAIGVGLVREIHWSELPAMLRAEKGW